MHLSKEIQQILNGFQSNIKLAETIDGTFPAKYAFYNNSGRNFRTEFAQTNKKFSIILFERTEKKNYEQCYARGIFNDINRLTNVIDLWIGQQKAISSIHSEFNELELYQKFEFQNPNTDIEKAWDKVKNMFFNDLVFWKNTEWRNRYNKMLVETKKHLDFQTYFPFTSHYWLRFSPKKDFISECWPLDTYIIPVMYSKELSKELGEYYVSFSDKTDGNYFAELKDALDFYSSILKETEPIKWTTNE